MRKLEKKVKLFIHKGCEDCQRNCPYDSLVAIREVAERDKEKFACNLSTAKVWLDKTFKEAKK